MPKPPFDPPEPEERLRVIADHLVREAEDGYHLIDTGSPLTMTAPPEAQRHVSERLTRVIGMDQLGISPFILDWEGRTLEQAASVPEGVAFTPLRSIMGIPATALTVHAAGGASSATALLDTGAPIGYAPVDAVEGLPICGTYSDFYPGLGDFETPLYEVDVELLGHRQTMTVGVLPPMLRMVLAMLGPDHWVLGADFFRGRRLFVDMPGGRIADLAVR